MIYRILKPIERLIDHAGWRGRLRNTPLYVIYKFIKALPMILDYRMVNLYSRELFRNILSKKNGQTDIYAEWIRSFQVPAERPLDNLKSSNPLPWMYIQAVHFMEWHLLNHPKPVILEWGGGTSTLWFSKFASNVYTIESHVKWAQTLSEEVERRNLSNVEILTHQPEPLSEEGINPKYISWWKDYRDKHFSSYVNAIDKIPEQIDLILIDGECRMACLEKALEHIKNNGLIVVDNSSRDRYRENLQQLEQQHRVIRVAGPTTYGQGYDESALIIKK